MPGLAARRGEGPMTVHEGRSFAVLVKHSIAPVWCAATFDRSRVSFQRGEAGVRARRDVAPGIRRRTRCGAADGCAGQCKGESLSAGPCGPARGGPNDSSRGEVIRCLGEPQYSADLMRRNMRSVTTVLTARRGGRWHVPAGLRRAATAPRGGLNRRAMRGCSKGKIKCRAIAARRGEVPITGHEGRSFTALEKTV